LSHSKNFGQCALARSFFGRREAQVDHHRDVALRDCLFTLILEAKGRPDPLEQVKAEAVRRWVNAVNTGGSFGLWGYGIVRDPKETVTVAVLEAWVGWMNCTK
jgi:hypothetical protein